MQKFVSLETSVSAALHDALQMSEDQELQPGDLLSDLGIEPEDHEDIGFVIGKALHAQLDRSKITPLIEQGLTVAEFTERVIALCQ